MVKRNQWWAVYDAAIRTSSVLFILSGAGFLLAPFVDNTALIVSVATIGMLLGAAFYFIADLVRRFKL